MSNPAFSKRIRYEPPAQPPPSLRTAKVEYPDGCRNYVQRSFGEENSVVGVSQNEVAAKLRDIITSITENNELHSTDWENLPLPQQQIQSERAHLHTKSPSLSSMQINDRTTNPLKVKKRKSSDDEDMDDASSWKNPLDHVNNKPTNVKPDDHSRHLDKGSLSDRIQFPQQEDSKRLSKRQRKEEDRQRRFREQTGGKPDHHASHSDFEKRRARFAKDELDEMKVNQQLLSLEEKPGPVVGTCQELEKQYFRLTSAAKPSTVRPVAVLERTLSLLRQKWKEEHNYHYICDQFKSLRQDLTVQHVKSEFTVRVYEIHARIALEKGDIGEYNQCQTQLRALYKQNLPGSRLEFLAYRILYFIYTNNGIDLNRALAELTLADRQDPAIKHALQTRSALALNNYHRFFQLYRDTPNLGAFLMDLFVRRERASALAYLSKA